MISSPDFSKLPPLPAEPPEELSPEAESIWTRLHPQLMAMRQLKSIDRPILSMLCSTLALLEEAEAKLAAEPHELLDDRGARYPNPWLEIRDTQRELAVKIMREFGLDAADEETAALFPQGWSGRAS